MPSTSWPSSVSDRQAEGLAKALTIPYAPHSPTARQSAFLLLDDIGIKEALYGGAAGGGKSDALLMGALRYVECPGYSALLLRRTYTDLSLPGAILDRAKEWLIPRVEWREQAKTFVFPSGASLSFGYLETDRDKYRYQSAEFQFIGLDELTQFDERQYRYMFSRLRRPKGSLLPLRMRAASNPGGRGHAWVKERFIRTLSRDRVFVPAKIDDNPHLDRDEYERTLEALHPVERAQLRDGNWDVQPAGGFFERGWFLSAGAIPVGARMVRYWDKAATPGGGDWTAGVKLALHAGRWVVAHVVRGRWAGPDRERVIRSTAAADGREVSVVVEQEPGSGGKDSAAETVRNLAGFPAYADPVSGDKLSRAKPFAAQAAAGNVSIVEGAWTLAFLDELTAFPSGSHDDQVDAVAGAFNWMSRVRVDSVGCF